MLYKETVAPRTLDLIKRFMQDEKFGEFRLVGGTALSLYIGHRISIDIDLFCNTAFDAASLSEHLNKSYKAEKLQTLKNGAFALVDDIKVDVIAHQYPWIQPPIIYDPIRMASLDDIGAMKVHAIVQSGSRIKDFVDVYFLLQHRSMNNLLNAYARKYPGANPKIALSSLKYFDDIDFDTPIKLMIGSLDWSKVATRLSDAVNNPAKLFEYKNPTRSKSRGKGI